MKLSWPSVPCVLYHLIPSFSCLPSVWCSPWCHSCHRLWVASTPELHWSPKPQPHSLLQEALACLIGEKHTAVGCKYLWKPLHKQKDGKVLSFNPYPRYEFRERPCPPCSQSVGPARIFQSALSPQSEWTGCYLRLSWGHPPSLGRWVPHPCTMSQLDVAYPVRHENHALITCRKRRVLFWSCFALIHVFFTEVILHIAIPVELIITVPSPGYRHGVALSD